MASPTQPSAAKKPDVPQKHEPNVEPQSSSSNKMHEIVSEPQSPVPSPSSSSISSPQELIQTGMNFFTNLAQTLKSAEKTQELVASIVKKDEASGKTYLQIPIENQEVVSNALAVLGSLFGGLMK